MTTTLDPGSRGRPMADGAVPIVATPVAERSLGWWGTLGLIATEGTLFALLLFVALFLRANNDPWPPEGIAKPELVTSSIRSVILIGSSIPAILAERALRQGRIRRFIVLVVVTISMGVVFLIGHAMEYLELSKDFTPTSHAYGSMFYSITGLHAVHLTVGLLVLAYLVVQALRGRYDTGGEHNGVRCGLLYWHFVDAVWVGVFGVLYLSEQI